MAEGPNPKRGMRHAGMLIGTGLLVQAGTLWGTGAVAFMTFACVGLLLTGLGIVRYLWAVVSATA